MSSPFIQTWLNGQTSEHRDPHDPTSPPIDLKNDFATLFSGFEFPTAVDVPPQHQDATPAASDSGSSPRGEPDSQKLVWDELITPSLSRSSFYTLPQEYFPAPSETSHNLQPQQPVTVVEPPRVPSLPHELFYHNLFESSTYDSSFGSLIGLTFDQTVDSANVSGNSLGQHEVLAALNALESSEGTSNEFPLELLLGLTQGENKENIPPSAIGPSQPSGHNPRSNYSALHGFPTISTFLNGGASILDGHEPEIPVEPLVTRFVPSEPFPQTVTVSPSEMHRIDPGMRSGEVAFEEVEKLPAGPALEVDIPDHVFPYSLPASYRKRPRDLEDENQDDANVEWKRVKVEEVEDKFEDKEEPARSRDKYRNGRKVIYMGDAYDGPERPYVCPQCSQLFVRNEHLKRHVNSIHEGLKDWICKSCNAGFSRPDNLAQHVRTHNKKRKPLVGTRSQRDKATQ